MRKQIIGAMAATLLVLASGLPTTAQSREFTASSATPSPDTTIGPPTHLMCGERTSIVHQLQTRFHERQEETVLRSNTSLIELFVSARGTWSILHTTPAGVSCLVATGDGLVPSAQL